MSFTFIPAETKAEDLKAWDAFFQHRSFPPRWYGQVSNLI